MSAPIGKLTEPYSGFDPRTIPGCVAWYDAADSSRVTLSGTNLSKWLDKSSNSNALIPNGDATRTSYSNTINGLRTVSVDGTGGTASLSNSNAFTLSQPNTSFIVARTRTTNFAGTFSLLYSQDTALFQYRNQFGSNLSMWAGTADVSQGNNIRFTSNAVRTHVAIFNSNSSFVGANGTMFSTGATPGTNGWINLQVLPTGAVVTQAGDCGEVIMYNSVLSSNNRQQIEGYLNWKWGIQQDLSTTHPYRSRTQPFTRPFYPLDVSGCALWLDATDPMTLLRSGTSSNIVQWNDKSGNAANVTNVYGSTVAIQSNAINGLPVLNTTSGRMSGAFASGSVLSNYRHTVFLITKLNSLPGNGAAGLAFAESSTGSAAFLRVIDYASANFRTVAIFADTNLTTIPSQTANHFLWTTTYSGASNGALISSQSNAGTQVTAAVTIRPPNNATHYFIGTDGFTNSQTFNSWPGLIGELIVYSSVLTTQERQQVEGYLAWKWGLYPNISNAHPFKVFAPFYPKFEPIQIPSCSLWLDGVDVSSIDLSGSGVSAWRDRSGRGNHAVQSTAANQPTYSSNGVVFNGALQNLTTSYSASLQNETMFFVATQTAPTTTIGRTIIGSSANGGRQLLTYTTQYAANAQGIASAGIGGVVVSNVRTLFGYRCSSGTSNTVNLLLDGTNVVTGSLVPYTAGLTSMIGKWPGSSTEGWVGPIHEIIGFNAALSVSDRQRVEGYLANKWGLGLVPTTAIPTAYSNCVLWLDAADTSTIDLSGSNVTVWRDKSGNNYNASNSANKGPTYSGGVLNFNGTSNYLSVPTFSMSSSTHCLIAVHKPTTLTGNNQGNTNVFRWQAPYYIVFPYMNGTTPRGYVTSADTSVLDALSSTLVEKSVTTAYNVITANISNGSQLIYRNGGLMSSNTQPMNTQTQSNFAIGSTVDTLSEFYQGSIAEMIIFNRRLPDSERQAVENHLISKWNTLGLLNEHPYKRAIP